MVEVTPRLLRESDGPMLTHGLQAMQNADLLVPKEKLARPDRDRLEVRYEQFMAAS